MHQSKKVVHTKKHIVNRIHCKRSKSTKVLPVEQPLIGSVNLEPVILLCSSGGFDEAIQQQQQHTSDAASARCLTTVVEPIPNNLNETTASAVTPAAITTAASQHNTHHHSQIIGSNNIHNSALAMSQLGTVYATKRRRRNGKRYVFFNLIKI